MENLFNKIFEQAPQKQLAKLRKIIRLALVPLFFAACNGISEAAPTVDSQLTLEPIAAQANSVEEEKQIYKKTPTELLNEYFALKNEFAIDPTVIAKLNIPETSDEEYRLIIDNWSNEAPIFLYLNHPQEKLHFIKYVLAQDDLDSFEYKSPDWGLDVDGDGVIETTLKGDGNVYNELGEVVDEMSFFCSDFSDELMKRYGLHVFGLSKDIKFQLPMMSVSTSEGYINDESRHAFGRGHAADAIFLGSKEEYEDFFKWYFIEPQSDENMMNPYINNYVFATISTLHDSSLERNGDSLASFFLMPGSFLEKIDDRELQILEEIEDWVSMNSKMRAEDDEVWSDEVELGSFNAGEIYRVGLLAIKSNYLSRDQVLGAFNDAKSLPDNFDYQYFLSTLDS